MNYNINSRTKLISQYYKYFIIGLFVRLFFASWTGHYYDLPIWLDSGKKLANGLSPYSSYIHLGQTILWAIWTSFSYLVSDLFFNSNLNVYIFVIKFLPIFFDMIAPIELILFINQISETKLSIIKEKTALTAIWLNPFFIIVSSFWGMIDNLSFLLIIISIYLIVNNKFFLPMILSTISIALKLYPVIFLPLLMLLLYWRQKNIRKPFFFGIGVFFTFLFIAYFPFLIFDWNNAQITGVLSSQLNRHLGGVTPLGIITTFTVGNEFSNYFLILFDFINGIYYLNYIWILASGLISIFFLVKYTPIFLKNETSKDADNRVLIKLGINLAISYFILWYFTAKYISEQNFIPFLGLILIKYLLTETDADSNKELKKFKSLNIFILLYLVFNTPLFVFFYLIIDLKPLVDHLIIFQFLRSLFMVITTLGILVIILRSLRDTRHE